MEIKYSCTQQEVNDNQKIFQQRVKFFKDFGLDIMQSHKNTIGLVSNKPYNILEIGTGKGHLTTLLADISDNIISVDIEKETQFIAALNVESVNASDKVRFVIADASNLDFSDDSFDLTISSLSYHHFDDPISVVKEMLRVTKNKLIISDFNENGFKLIEKIQTSEGKKHIRKNNCFGELKSFFEKLSLKVTELSDNCQNLYLIEKGTE